jgi:low temperature requirement protein LtrA
MAEHAAIFRPPQLHTGEEGHQRRVTWMELFYDLVYVATLVQLGNFLSDNVTPAGFGIFALLFVPVWWSWIGTTFYANRFDSDDFIHRLLVFAQIACVYLMAISLAEGLGENTARFALAYAANRAILVVMYFRAARHIPQARALATRYGMGFAIAAAIWAASALFPAPVRYVVWGIAFLVDFGTPIVSIPLQRMLPPAASHLPERFGLFTIIVLGEGFLKVINGMAGEVLTIPQILLDVPGLIISGALWWIYFDNVAESRVVFSRLKAQVWLYAHLPLHLALTALGVGIYKLVTSGDSSTLYDEYRWLICSSAALALLMIGIIEWALTTETHNTLILRAGGAAVALILAIIGTETTGTAIMIGLGLIGVAQVGVDLYGRARRGGAAAHAAT